MLVFKYILRVFKYLKLAQK